MNLLDRIEKLGNRLPDPATLFVIGTIVIIFLSGWAQWQGWQATSRIAGDFHARSLLTSDGIWWLLSHLVDNFINFPPLGIVLVGMLGIGLAEASGLLPDMLRYFITHVPEKLLTPATVFIGVMSSLALDAGYVVLPPLAAALYQAAGRSPLVGIAAVFAGISAGFSANLSITALDPLLAGLTQSGAQVLLPGYTVAVTANWWFMIVSTVLLTLAGWLVTDWFVEPRQHKFETSIAENPPAATAPESSHHGLRNAVLALLVLFILVLMAVVVPGAPLYGAGEHFDRWVEATVPLLFLLFFVPGLIYGLSSRSIKSDRDVAGILGNTMARMGTYIVLAFFAAQFIECFKYSRLGEMLAISGGQWLASLHIPTVMLLICFIVLVMFANLLIGSASAKYAFFAPVFVPMFMQVGISPELTQAVYRVGDSVTNTITPLNPYMIIMLVYLQQYSKKAGIGTLIAMMLPYTAVFAVIWSLLLVIWYLCGFALGPAGPLHITL